MIIPMLSTKALKQKYEAKVYNSEIMTMQQAMQDKSLTLGKINVQKPIVLEGLIEGWIVWLNKMLPPNYPKMPMEQVTFCAKQIVNDYKHLRFSDLSVCFRRIANSKHFGSLSMNSIIDTLDQYTEEKFNAFEQRSMDYKNQNSFNEVRTSDNTIKEFIKDKNKSINKYESK